MIKITGVETLYLRLPTITDRTDSSQDTLIVKVTTDAGITGYGEVDSCPLVVKAIIEAPKSHSQVHGLRDLLLGQNPLENEYLWNRMYQGTLYYGRSGAVIQAMAGIDLALWDIKGKVLGQPVYELLGGGYRDRIRAYASHMFEFTPEATGRRAREAVDHGFTAVKFGWEPMGPDRDLDVALVKAIRTAVGKDVDVMVDAGLGWDSSTAMQRCRLFEPFDIFWLEEPLHPDNLTGYARLSNATDTRIAAGEQECTVDGFLRLMDQGQIDVVQIDLTRVGLTQAMKIAHQAQLRGLPCANHAFTTDVNIAAGLHFLASIPNALILEYCVEPSEIRRSLVRNPVRVEDGTVRVPQEPGLGVELNSAIIEKYLVRD